MVDASKLPTIPNEHRVAAEAERLLLERAASQTAKPAAAPAQYPLANKKVR